MESIIVSIVTQEERKRRRRKMYQNKGKELEKIANEQIYDYRARSKVYQSSKYETEHIDLIKKYIALTDELYGIIDEYKREIAVRNDSQKIDVFYPVCQNKYGRTYGSVSLYDSTQPPFVNTIEEAYVNLKHLAEQNYENIKKASPNKKVKLKKYTWFYKKRDYSKPFSFKTNPYDCLFVITSDGKPLQKFKIVKETFQYSDPDGIDTFEDWSKTI